MSEYYRPGVIMALCSIAAMRATVAVVDQPNGGDDVLRDRKPAPIPVFNSAPAPAKPKTEHTHSREIARRLRQEERRLAKQVNA